MKRYLCVLLAGLAVAGCCTKKLCLGQATLEFTGFPPEELEKAVCRTRVNSWTGDQPVQGKKRLTVSVTESPIYVFLSSDTLEITVRFRSGQCNTCTFGFMEPVYREVSGFVLAGKETTGNTLSVRR